MCPINAHPEYLEAEKKFNYAQTDEERLIALEEMIKTAPKHKGGESLRKQIKSRHKKLREKLNKEKQKAKSRGKSQPSIRKGDMQAAIIGYTNVGKSSILKALTNVNPKIASYGFTTTQPEQGILNHQGCSIQIVDLPPVGSESFNRSIAHSADTLLIVVEKIHELEELKEFLLKFKSKQIIIFNKIDLYDDSTKRKITETLKSKRYNFVLTSTLTNEGIEELKEKIFKSFSKIRVYTKQPNQDKHDNEPMILNPKSTVEEAAQKTLHGMAKSIKKVRIWGPSSKFGGQVVGMKHILKDKDVIEFTTK